MFWGHDWAWGLPLILATIITHVVVLGFVTRTGIEILTRAGQRRKSLLLFSTVIGVIALLSTALLALESIAWGYAYLALGALPDTRTAFLYSLNAMTAFGHTDIHLDTRWRLMGALEALNGIILFGLTIGFLFATIQSSGPLRSR